VTGSTLFAGVDRALFAATYADRLRRAAVPVAFTSVERCVASLAAVGPLSVDDAYWLLRLSFVTRQQDIAIFDEVFEAVFDVVLHHEMGSIPNAQAESRTAERPDADDDQLIGLNRSPEDSAATSTTLPWATLPAAGDTTDDDPEVDDDDHIGLPELAPADVAARMDRPFDLLDEGELERIGAWLDASMNDWPQRRSRRHRPAPTGGRIALRRTMRSAMRTGGDVVTLLRDRPQPRPRPVVVLLDVSGSMESYARIYLHLIRPLALAHRAEVFAFATELSRVTPAIRRRTSADVIDHMNTVVGDRFSGTRLASSISTLLHHRTWSTSLRGAVVLICSDGWDSDEPAALDRAMRRVSLLAHRVVWVNPRAAADGFEPLTQGMSIAHPYCDAFLAGNTARSMSDVVAALGDPRA
jgi:uncharacterized protein with von Willebrand factor type A (vWA) domain